MACEEAAGAPGVAKAKPGDEVRWEWEGATPELSNAGFKAGSWVHAMGPTVTYIASCNGDCRTTPTLPTSTGSRSSTAVSTAVPSPTSSVTL
ncbi:hypothetical protein PM082_018808 [Marasmius tenuissimus]|nr:hypothetical protein PM082_018808 [Marasmius tenuissimus]